METEYRKRGRPPAHAEIITKPTEYVELAGKVMPHICPACGKGQQPTTINRMPEYVNVRCSACGRSYQYFPSKTRVV